MTLLLVSEISFYGAAGLQIGEVEEIILCAMDAASEGSR